ncbi:MAG: glycosyl hydrolase-related protein, partial [bacterium]
GDWQSAEIYREALNAHCRLWPETIWLGDNAKWQTGPYGFEQYYKFPEGNMPPEQSLMTIQPAGAILSACKKAESGDALILRLYNTTPDPKEFHLQLFKEARNVASVNMLEEEVEDSPKVTWRLSEDGRTQIDFSLKGFEIITLRLEVDAPQIRLWPQTIY